MIWFISDTHFGHANIIGYTQRPFKDIDEMDAKIISNWNERVSATDTVFHLGDFCLTKSSEAPNAPKDAFNFYRNQLKGNIIFIAGNHDGNNRNNSIIESAVIKHGGSRIYLTHDPKFAKEDFLFNFCGHVHEKWQFRRLGKKTIVVNLSVEHWRYMPVEINEILGACARWRHSKHE